MSELTPEERERIHQVEKARIESNQAVKSKQALQFFKFIVVTAMLLLGSCYVASHLLR